MTPLSKTISDVLSPTEVKDLLMRMKVATLLHQKVTYREITKETGAGAATIARIAKRLKKGASDIRGAKQEPNQTTLKNRYAFGATISDPERSTPPNS